MKLISQAGPLVASATLAVALSGCAAAPSSGNDHSHAAMASMDMQSHCEMHKKKMAGKSSAEQQSMMQEHMKSMTPEMRQRMQAMHEQCK
jgi:hypothetical protein